MKCIVCLCLSCFLFLMDFNYRRDNFSSLTQTTPAPEDKPIFIGEGLVANQTMWSSNSTDLYFTGLDMSARFYRYSLGADQLTKLEALPLTKPLTRTEQLQFEATNAVASLSPNGRYIVYTRSAQVRSGERSCYPKLALGDLSNGKHLLIDGRVCEVAAIHWSTDSSAFVIIDVGGGGLGGVSYVGVSSTFENGLRPILLMNYLVGTEGFVAISPDGQRVLLRQYWDGQYRGMYLWDVVGANTRQQFSALGSPLILKDIPIAGATFLHDRNRLLVITDIGLVQYEVDRRTSTLMYPGLDTSWVDWALFSPDAHYVAVLTHPALDTLGSQHTCLVYVLVLNGQTITPPGRSHPCHSYG